MNSAAAEPRPAFSVIMPVYNGSQHLAEALDSLLLQTFGDFEIVAVDDGSRDDSWDVLTRYAAIDARVRPHRLEQNRGHCVASNVAVQHATGRYIARQDQDDVALPRRLELAADVLDKRSDIGFVYSAYLRWLPDGTLLPRSVARSHTALRLALLFGNRICHSSVTARREVWEALEGPYRDVAGPQDYDVWIRALAIARSHGIEEPTVVYRQESMAMTEMYADRMADAVDTLSLDQLHDLIPGADLPAVRRVHSYDHITARDAATLQWLHAAYLAAASQERDLDPAEVDRVRARWTADALHLLCSRSNEVRSDPRVFWHLVRGNPRGLVRWLDTEISRVRGRVDRH